MKQLGDNLKPVRAMLSSVGNPSLQFSCREIERMAGVRNGTVGRIERHALEKIRAALVGHRVGRIQIKADHRSDAAVVFGNPVALSIQAAASDALPGSIVWMPAGRHNLTAHTLNGDGFQGAIICDEQASRAVAASFNALQASGNRVWLDCDHDDGAAAAWVKSFSWDAAQGIMAHVEWTSRGETALRGKEFFSFSPAFEAEAKTGRVVGLLRGHAAGGLVNAPAFGAAMPALIAARLGSNINQKEGAKSTQEKKTMNELLIKLLAALKITAPTDATEEQLVALVAKHSADTTNISAEVVALKAKLDDAEKSAKAEANKVAIAAKANADAVIAIEKKQTELAAVQAAILAGTNNPTNVQVTASVEDVVKGYARMNIKNEGSMERGIFFRDAVAPVLKRVGGLNFGQLLAKALPILAKNVDVQAANSLGTLVGNLVSQQSLALLKYEFPELGLFTTDFSNASVKKGQTILTRLKTAIAASAYTGTFTAADSTDSDVSVVVDTHTYAQVAFNANELGSTNRDLFGEQAEVLNYAVGKDLIDALYALMTIINYPTTALILGSTGGGTGTVDGTGYSRQSAIFAAKQLNILKIPKAGRFNLLNSDAVGALLADPAVVSWASFQKPEIISENALPRIAGFTGFETVNLPTTGNMVAFAGTPRAAIIATRVPNDYTTALSGSSYGNVATVTDPNTGMTVLNTQYVNHDTGTSNSRVSVMRGVAKGDPVAGLITKHV